MEDAAIDHELLPMLLSLAERSWGLLLRMVDGAADQLAISELAVRSTDHTSLNGEDVSDGQPKDACDDVSEGVIRNHY